MWLKIEELHVNSSEVEAFKYVPSSSTPVQVHMRSGHVYYCRGDEGTIDGLIAKLERPATPYSPEPCKTVTVPCNPYPCVTIPVPHPAPIPYLEPTRPQDWRPLEPTCKVHYNPTGV